MKSNPSKQQLKHSTQIELKKKNQVKLFMVRLINCLRHMQVLILF